MTDKDLQAAYQHYNRKFFGGILPKIRVQFKKLPKRECGRRITYKGNKGNPNTNIYINWELRKWPTIARSTLLHEMVHVLLPARYGHGPVFQRAMLHLAKQGAFEKLW